MESAAKEATNTVNQPSTASGNHATTSHSEAPSNTDERCALLALPTELRNRIYAYAVVQQPYVNVDPRPRPTFRDPNLRGRQAALTRTCRQIRHESLGLFYELNLFRVAAFLSEGQAIAFFDDHLDEIKEFQLEIPYHAHDVVLYLENGLTEFTLSFVPDQDKDGECSCLSGEPKRILIRSRLENALAQYRSSSDKMSRKLLSLLFVAIWGMG